MSGNILNRFDSIDAFLERTAEKIRMPKAGLQSELEGSYWERWTGTPSLPAARALAAEGWNDRADEIYRLSESARSRVQESIVPVDRLMFSVEGFAPDVGMFLSGEPDCMIDTFVEPGKKVERTRTVLVSVAASSVISADGLMKRGAACAAMVSAIEGAGIDANVWVEMTVAAGGRRLSYLIRVKRAGESVDPAHLAFWVAHPSVLRRLVFAAMEREDAATRKCFKISVHGSFGMPCPSMHADEIGADLVIDTMRLGENPDAWILEQVKKLGLEVRE